MAAALLAATALLAWTQPVVAQVPAGWAARWVADAITAADMSVAPSIDVWRDSGPYGLHATPHDTARKPTLKTRAAHCRSAVAYTGGQSLSTVPNTVLDPGSGGFAVFFVAQLQSTTNYAQFIVKADSAGGAGYNQGWEVNTNYYGNVQCYLQDYWLGAIADSHRPFSATGITNGWMMEIKVDDAFTGTKGVRGYTNNDRATWFDGGLDTYKFQYTGSFVMSSKLYLGPLYRTLGANMYEYIIYNREVTPAERQAVFDYFDAQYYLTCPTLNAANAANGNAAVGRANCAGTIARYGRQCQQTCNGGFVAAYGTTEHLCTNGQWSGSSIVCFRECPAVPYLTNMQDCQQTYLEITNWSSNTTMTGGMWLVEPPVPASEMAQYWAMSGSSLRCVAGSATCSLTAPQYFVASSPSWVAIMAPEKAMTYEATLTPTTMNDVLSYAGLVFRYQDSRNHMGVTIQCSSLGAAVTSDVYVLQAGVTYTLSRVATNVACGVSISVRVLMRRGLTTVLLNGAPLHDGIRDSTFATGTVGFAVSGSTFAVQSMRLTADCDSGACLSSTPGMQCTQTCSPGYTLIGSATRSCTEVGNGASPSVWSGIAPTCVIDPPRIDTDTVQYVDENSPVDTAVGLPIVAISSAPRVTLTYEILSEQPPPSNIGQPRFAIGGCSGQLIVFSQNDRLDYEDVREFQLTIRVTPNGQSASAAVGVITVRLRDVREPPFFVDGGFTRRDVNEMATQDENVGAALAVVDPDTAQPSALRFYIIADGSAGIITVRPDDGQLTVAGPGRMNFESTTRSYIVVVRCEKREIPELFADITVEVNVQDGNDPVTLPFDQQYFIAARDATTGRTAIDAIAYADEDVGQIHTFSITGGNVDPADTLQRPAVLLDDVSTGNLSWAIDRSVWPDDAPTYAVDGQFVYTTIRLHVGVADGGGAAATGDVLLHIVANVTAPPAAPILDDVQVGGTTEIVDVPTMGGTALRLLGRNFPVSGATPFVTYGTAARQGNATATGPSYAYNATACTVVTSSLVQCTTSPGVGRSLVLSLTFIATSSGTPTAVTASRVFALSYIAPAVTGVTVAASAGMATAGGTQLVITGTNLGGLAAAASIVMGTSASIMWMASSAVTVATHTSITVLAPPGAGANLTLQVIVGGQSSAPQRPAGLSFAPPVITGLAAAFALPYTVTSLPWGRLFIEVTGDNFGPASLPAGVDPSPFIFTYAPATQLGPSTWDAPISFIPGGAAATFPSKATVFTCAKLLPDPHRQMVCSGVATSAGAGMSAAVLVVGQTSLPSVATVAAAAGGGVLAHAAPVIFQVSGQGASGADTAGGQQLVVEAFNVGPVGLTGAASAMLSVAYGKFAAASCAVVVESTLVGGLGRVECVTGEGYGVDHAVTLRVGGQATAPATGASVSYAGPIVTYFSGSLQHDTRGGDLVHIHGRNLYRDIAIVNVSYSALVDPLAVSGLPADAYYGVAVDRSNRVWFAPPNCSFAVPHTELQCTTAPGAGGALKWLVTVNGTVSREPYTEYRNPAVVAIVNALTPLGWANGTATVNVSAPGAAVVTASPLGGTQIYLVGNFFGPAQASTRLLQWVRHTLPGVSAFRYIAATPSTLAVVNDSVLAVTLGPGYGSGLRFEVQVAGQSSGMSTAAFSFAPARLTSLTPANGTTDRPPVVTLTVEDSPYVDTALSFRMRFGNAADGTLRVVDCARTVAAAITTLQCAVPAGMGRRRTVQLEMYRAEVVGSVVPVSGALQFDYLAPAIDYVTFENPNAPAWRPIVGAMWSNPTGVRIVALYGTNFGPAGGFGSVQRGLDWNYTIPEIPLTLSGTAMAYPGSPIPAVSSLHTFWYSWSDRRIVLMTKLDRFTARVALTALDADGVTPLISTSNTINLSQNQPRVSGIIGAPAAGYDVDVDAVMTVEIPWSGLSGISTMELAIISRVPLPYGAEQRLNTTCTIANLNWDRTGPAIAGDPSTAVPSTAPALARRVCSDHYAALGTTMSDASPCNLHCILSPLAQGDDAQVSLIIDGVPVISTQTVAFAAPLVTEVMVTDLVAAVNATYDVIANPTTPVIIPTTGAVVTVRGRNLGGWPNFLYGSPTTPNAVYALLTPTSDKWVARGVVRMPAAPGEGTIDAATGQAFVFQVQTSRTQVNMQPTGAVILMRYAAPSVAAVTASTGTRGGVAMVITGRNFGAANLLALSPPPVVTLVPPEGSGRAPLSCASPVRNSHTEVVCTVPAGAGAGFTVQLVIANQSSTEAVLGAAAFSYLPPRITSVQVETWPKATYAEWPASWTGRNRSAAVWRNVGLRSGAGGPTRGANLVRLRGVNFGPRDAAASCAFAAAFTTFVDCADPQRFGEPQCACESSAGLCQHSWFTLMRAAVPGLPALTCDGHETFAGEGEIYNPTNTSLAPSRDDPQLAAGFIVDWDHEAITLTMPAGAGVALLTVSVGGQMPVADDEAWYRYDAPVITRVRLLEGSLSTRGSSIVELTGYNLGASLPDSTTDVIILATPRTVLAPVAPASGNGSSANATSATNSTIPLPIVPTLTRLASRSVDDAFQIGSSGRPLPIRADDMIPVTGARLLWWQYCITAGRVYVPTRPVGGYAAFPYDATSPCVNRNASAYRVLAHSHERLVVRAHAGVGTARNISLAITGVHSTLAGPSAPVLLSYDPPAIRAFRPIRVVLMTGGESVLRVAGDNYGDLADSAAWSFYDRIVAIDIDGIPANRTSRQLATAEDEALGYGVVEGYLSSDLVVGPKTVEITVAGQRGRLAANATVPAPLMVACGAGYFGNVSERCEACPIGALCSGYDIATGEHRYPRPLPTFFTLNGSMLTACPEAVATDPRYAGRNTCIVGCYPPEACAGDNVCSEAYESRAPMYRCASCAKGFYRRSAECVKCPDSPYMMVIGFVLMAVAAASAAYFLNSRKVNIAFITIGVDYFQVLALFANTRIAWPPQLKELFFVLSAFNLNIEIVAPECLVPDMSYSQKWYAIMLIPLVVLALFLLIFAARIIQLRCLRGVKAKKRLFKSRHMLVSMFLALFYFAYLYLSRTLLEPFNCVPATPDDGVRYMAATMEPCDQPGSMQQRLIAPAIAGLILYTVGYPAYVAYSLWANRVEIMEDQLLRAMGKGDDLLTNPHAYYVRKRIGRLYYAFKPDFYWWSLLIIGRKFFIAFAALMFRNDGAFQLAMVLLFIFAAFSLQTRFQPYMSPSERAAVLAAHERQRLESHTHAVLGERLKEIALAGRKKQTRAVNWSAPRSVVAREVAASVGSYFFNYNTLESVLLCSALLVCLSGIMFETLSRASATAVATASTLVAASTTRGCSAQYTFYCSGLVWAIILLATATIIYFFTVLVLEALTAAAEQRAAAAGPKGRSGSGSFRAAGKDGEASSRSPSRAGSARSISSAGGDSMSVRVSAGGGGTAPVDSESFAARVGIVHQSFNPLFDELASKSTEDEEAREAGMANALAILEREEPPNKGTWLTMQRWCRLAIVNNRDQMAALAELKRKVAEMEMAMESGGTVSARRVDSAGGGNTAGTPRVLTRMELASQYSRKVRLPARKAYNPILATGGQGDGSGSDGIEMAALGLRADSGLGVGAGAGVGMGLTHAGPGVPPPPPVTVPAESGPAGVSASPRTALGRSRRRLNMGGGTGSTRAVSSSVGSGDGEA